MFNTQNDQTSLKSNIKTRYIEWHTSWIHKHFLYLLVYKIGRSISPVQSARVINDHTSSARDANKILLALYIYFRDVYLLGVS